MQPKTEQFLNLLLWSAEMLAHPTFRNLTDSYESWAYQKGFMRQVADLEKRHLVRRRSSTPDDRCYRLSARGRLHVLGGRDPEAGWAKPWDGQWRMVLFDIPSDQNAHRERLRRYLRKECFGHLQDSVWIHPHELSEERRILRGGRVDVSSLILLTARPCAGESNKEIVAGAWNFDRINNRYAEHMKVLRQKPAAPLRSRTAAKALQRWASAERSAWLEAVTSDPLLPEILLPRHYLGQKAWRRRVDVLRTAGRQLTTFTGP